MFRATFYITLCTTRNRARRWIHRLREPRYLAGFLAALTYLYFAMFRRFGVANRRRRTVALAALPALSGSGPALAGMAILLAAGASWLVPGTGRLLEFSPAEVQFLFPAPVARRHLLIHRLLRSQMGLLFASLVPAVAFALPSGTLGTAARWVVGIWLLLVTARVYFSGVTLARSQLFAANRNLRRLARIPLAVVLVIAAMVVGGLTRTFVGHPPVSGEDLFTRIGGLVAGGRLRIVLWPFEALAMPLFASSGAEYVTALGASALVMAVVLAWVLASDSAFQDVVAEVVAYQDEQPQRGRMYRARKSEWTLAPIGRPEGAFVWKSAMQAFRVVDRRVLLRLAVIVFSLALLIVVSNRTEGLAAVVGLFAAAGAFYTVLLAPQILRLDFRQDLQHLELLKTWPVRAAAIVRGEIIGPAAMLTLIAWALLGLALFLSTAAFSTVSAAWRVSVGASAACLAPALIFGQYAIHNALALVFPAWVPLGVQRPRGLDAMGQRLLTLGATWLGLAIMLLPGVIAGGMVSFVFYPVTGPWIFIPASALCAVAMALEILLTTEALGPAYERLDLTAVERPD